MDNFQASSALQDIAELLEIQGESAFKIRAYQRAARVIRSLSQDINDLDGQGKLTDISGIGRGIADRLHELLTTGKITYLEELKNSVPAGVFALLHVSGLGPKKAKLIYDELGIATLDQLKAAALAGKLRDLPGMGSKTEANILRSLELLEKSSGRLLLNEAVPAAEGIVEYMRTQPRVEAVEVAGSLRRRRETVGDIDILCATEEPVQVADSFCAYGDVARVQAKDDTKCSVVLQSGLQVDLRLIEPAHYGAALQYFTGSQAHNIRIHQLARENGLKVSEYGVFELESDRLVAGRTEGEVYRALGLDWIDPALREDRGEIEAAAAGELPRLLQLDEIRGDLHIHTKASDGQSTLHEMVVSARSIGHKYMAISDHAFHLKVAGGLSADEFERQWREIDALNKDLTDFTVLKGVELNIDSAGQVDFPDEFLARFDIVTASIHSGFTQDMATITNRVITAARNPHIDVIGHPTGRILGRREPYAIDMSAVFAAAAETGTALELNAFPDRLDLTDEYLIEARKAGCRVAINTDAHYSGQLSYMRYGVDIARRGWLECADVINTFELERLASWLRDKKSV